MKDFSSYNKKNKIKDLLVYSHALLRYKPNYLHIRRPVCCKSEIKLVSLMLGLTCVYDLIR